MPEEQPQRPPHTHRPEFVFIENERHEQSHTHATAQIESTAFVGLRDVHYKWHVRLMAFFWAFCLWFLSFLILLAVCCLAVGTVFTLGYHKATRRGLKKFYSLCCKIAVLALGFSVAVFSPAFGIAIIFVYFALLGETLNSEILSRFIRTSGDTQVH